MPSEHIKIRAACKRRMGVGCKLEAEGIGDVGMQPRAPNLFSMGHVQCTCTNCSGYHYFFWWQHHTFLLFQMSKTLFSKEFTTHSILVCSPMGRKVWGQWQLYQKGRQMVCEMMYILTLQWLNLKSYVSIYLFYTLFLFTFFGLWCYLCIYTLIANFLRPIKMRGLHLP